MEEKGFTSSSFADALNMNRPTLLHILSGRNKPNLQLIKSLAELDRDIDLRYILTGMGSVEDARTQTQEQLHFENSTTEDVKPSITATQTESIVLKERIVLLKPDGSYRTYISEES